MYKKGGEGLKDTIVTICGVVGGFLSYVFGGNYDIECLLIMVSLDIFIGVLACFVNPKLMFNSAKMRRGLIYKFIEITLVVVSYKLDLLCNTNGIIMKTVCWFAIANEFLSCVENAGKCGVKYPAIIENSLEQLKGIDK